MGRVISRRLIGASLAVSTAMALGGPISPIRATTGISYTLTVNPMTAVADLETDFTVTVTNSAGPDKLGCVEVTLPNTYEIVAVSDPVSSSADRPWRVVAEDGTVVAHAEEAGGPLAVSDFVAFVVTARPKEAGVTAWTHHAHHSKLCDDENQEGEPVDVVITVPTPTPTSLPTATPTPTPKPTPMLTPKPTSRPTPQPTPAPLPTATPTPIPSPTGPPSPRSTPVIVPGPDSAAPGTGDGSGRLGAGTGIGVLGTGEMAVAWRASPDDDAGSVGLGSLAAATGSVIFAVPAAVLGGPGLLILAWIAIQALGTATWLPAVRRLRGRDTRAR